MRILLLTVVLCLSGCTQITVYTLAHKEAFAAAGIVAGTSQTFIGLFNQADEAEKRIEKREKDGDS